MGFAIAAHTLALVPFLINRDDSAGGGQVLGHLSVSLGNAAASNETQAEQQHPSIEQARYENTSSQEAPEASTPQLEQMEKATARTKTAEPIERPQEQHKTRKSDQRPLEKPQSAYPSPSGRLGTTSTGTPTVSEGAPSATAGLGASDNKDGTARDAYLATIRARIEDNRIYPSAARREKTQGTVVLTILIGPLGELDKAHTTRSSGSFHLDRAARQMVEKSAPFPPPPEVPFAATVPIAFAIR